MYGPKAASTGPSDVSGVSGKTNIGIGDAASEYTTGKTLVDACRPDKLGSIFSAVEDFGSTSEYCLLSLPAREISLNVQRSAAEVVGADKLSVDRNECDCLLRVEDASISAR